MTEPRFLELDDAVSRIKQACEGRSNDSPSPFFFMVGAGISCPSIPLALDIVTKCKKVAQAYGRSREPVEKNSLDVYSHWFQNAYAEPTQRQQYLRELTEGRPITHANFRLAHLLLNNTISNIVVTTNFDDFLSKALTLFGKPHIVCDHPQTVGRINHTRPLLQIVHLHGSYWFYDCCNLRGELEDRAQQSPQTTSTMASLLDMILWDRSPLIIGYSGWEGDVFMEALKRRLARPLGSSVYWFCHRRTAVESIPQEFKDNPNIWFVVPNKKVILEPEIDTIREETKAMDLGFPAKKNEDPTLPADAVFDRLIQAFDLEAPALTKDPLGFFATRLDDSLPKDEARNTDNDIYAIKHIIERVRRAKQREEEEANATIKPSESKLEQVRDALRRADYREAVKHGSRIQLSNLSTEDLDELADAMWSAANGLLDNSEEEMSAYNLVVTIRDKFLKELLNESPAMKIQVAQALVNKGLTFAALNRSEQAITVYDDVVQRYGESTEVALRAQVARALFNKGSRLGALNRTQDELTLYDQIVERFGESTEPALRGWVGRAFNEIGYRCMIRSKALQVNGDERAALDELQRAQHNVTAAIERDPHDSIVLGNQAYIAFLFGRKSEARKLLMRAIALGGEGIRHRELKVAEMNRLREDDEFCEMVRSIPASAHSERISAKAREVVAAVDPE